MRQRKAECPLCHSKIKPEIVDAKKEEFLANEIFTIDDIKEAFMLIRSCGSVATLTKAIAAAIARTREEAEK